MKFRSDHHQDRLWKHLLLKLLRNHQNNLFERSKQDIQWLNFSLETSEQGSSPGAQPSCRVPHCDTLFCCGFVPLPAPSKPVSITKFKMNLNPMSKNFHSPWAYQITNVHNWCEKINVSEDWGDASSPKAEKRNIDNEELKVFFPFTYLDIIVKKPSNFLFLHLKSTFRMCYRVHV